MNKVESFLYKKLFIFTNEDNFNVLLVSEKCSTEKIKHTSNAKFWEKKLWFSQPLNVIFVSGITYLMEK